MIFAHADATRPDESGRRPDHDRQLEGWFGARARRFLGMAALTILVAWLVIVADRSADLAGSPIEPDSAAGTLQPEGRPLFDGRGKWSGGAD